MSETKHTPGPWRVNKYGSIGAGEYGSDPIVAMVEPFYGPDKKHGNHVANARLIAAAPDMLEALKRALNYLLNTQGELGIAEGSADELQCTKLCRAAIRKAEGRS